MLKPQTLDLVWQLARLTGESPGEALHYAVLERLEQVRQRLEPAASPEDRGIRIIAGFVPAPLP